MKLVIIASFTVLVCLSAVSGNIANQLLTKEQESYEIDRKQEDAKKVTKNEVKGGESTKNGKNIFSDRVPSSFSF